MTNIRLDICRVSSDGHNVYDRKLTVAEFIEKYGAYFTSAAVHTSDTIIEKRVKENIGRSIEGPVKHPTETGVRQTEYWMRRALDDCESLGLPPYMQGASDTHDYIAQVYEIEQED